MYIESEIELHVETTYICRLNKSRNSFLQNNIHITEEPTFKSNYENSEGNVIFIQKSAYFQQKLECFQID